VDAVVALLRTAARIADARAAIVAFDGDPTPLAFQGCTLGAAATSLREGEGYAVACEAPGIRASLHVVGATAAAPTPALEAVARELGVAMLRVSPDVDAHLAGLAASVEGVADPVMISRVVARAGDAAPVAYVNAAFERLFGYTPSDLDGHPDEKLFSAASLESVVSMRERLLAGENVRSIVVSMRSRDGEPLWVDLGARIARDGGTSYFVSVLRDITARRAFETALAAEKQRLLVTLKAIGDGVITVVPDGRIDFVNAAAQRMLGITTGSEVYGKGLRSVVNLVDDHNERREIALDPHGDVRGEGRLDTERHVQIAFVSSPILSASGETLGFVVVLRDVTAQARLTRRLAYEASHDALTRLPNRRHFEEMVGVAVESAQDRTATHTVAFIDLDHFKSVNDTLGHQGGDRLLRLLAERMSRVVRGNDILARIGGDEFALLLHECTTENALRVLEKLRTTVCETAREIVGSESKVSASIGLAPLGADVSDASTVLAAADRACYAAKAGGRNAIVVADVTAKSSG
jgi:Amt family ammonium transporter